MFSNQVVWITGASSGIGEALAVRFAATGSKLVLSARRETELERVKGLCLARGRSPGEVLVLPLDVTRHAAMPAAVERVIEAFGRIDLLFNNAGVSQRSKCVDTDLEVYRRLIEVDLLGQIALTKAVLPSMLARQAGHIAVTSSVAGKVGAPYRTGYCAAKHGVMGFFDALRAELSGDGIRVTTIVPGFVRTPISHHALSATGEEFGRMDRHVAGGMDPDAAAERILSSMRKGRPEIAIGTGIEMHALWLKRFFPGLLLKLVSRVARPDEAA